MGPCNPCIHNGDIRSDPISWLSNRSSTLKLVDPKCLFFGIHRINEI